MEIQPIQKSWKKYPTILEQIRKMINWPQMLGFFIWHKISCFQNHPKKKLREAIVPGTDWVCRYLLPLPHRWRSAGTSWRSRSTARWRPSWSPWPAVRFGYNCPAVGSWSSSTGHNPWRCCLVLLPQIGKHVAMAMQNSKSFFCGFLKEMVPSGKQPHNYGKIHHLFMGK